MKILKITFKSLLFFACILLLNLSFTYSGNANTVTVQPFQMKKGRKVWGVVLRQSDHHFVVALPYEVIEIKRRDVMIPGNMAPEANKVDEILTIIENAIEGEEFERINPMRPTLSDAISAYEAIAKPFIESQIETPHQRQDCLKQALSYYQKRKLGIPKSVKALKISNDVNDLAKKHRNKQLKFNIIIFEQIIKYRNDLLTLVDLFKKAEKAKSESLKVLSNIYQESYEHLQTVAINKFIHSKSTEKSLKLMTALSKGGAVAPDYENKFYIFIDKCLENISAYRATLTSQIDTIFILTGKIELQQRNISKTTSNLRDIEDFLVSLHDLVFGSQSKKYRALLNESIGKNKAILDEGMKRKELILEIRSNIRQAKLSYEKDLYENALEQFRKIQSTIANSTLPKGDVSNGISNFIIQSEALYILQKIQNPDGKTLDDMESLINESTRFIEKNDSLLNSLNISTDGFRKDIEKLGNYREFYRRFQLLKKGQSEVSVKSWNRIIDIDSLLVSLGTNINQHAINVWKSFLDQNQDQIFKNAVSNFLNDVKTINQKNWSLFESLVQYCKLKNNGPKAQLLMEKITPLLNTSNDTSFSNELLELKLEIGVLYVANNQLDQAYILFREIESESPEFAKLKYIGEMIAFHLQKLGGSQEKNEPLAALKNYQKIGTEYPRFAEKNKIFEKIISLEFDIEADQIKEGVVRDLDILENLCRDYKGKIGNIKIVREKSDGLKNRYEKLWQTGDYDKAVTTYIEFAKNYVNFSKETDLINELFDGISTHIYKMLQESRKSQKPLPNTLIKGLENLIKNFPLQSSKNRLDIWFVDLKIARANDYIRTGQIVRAFEVFHELVETNPELINPDTNLEEKNPNTNKIKELKVRIDRLSWKYKLEKWLTPLGIAVNNTYDIVALIFALLIWPFFLFRAYNVGKQKGHLSYRLIHCVVVFFIFLALQCAFVYGKYPFYKSFIFAFTLPIVFFHCLGFSTYLFFPLIYCERILNIETSINNFLTLPIFNKLGVVTKLAGVFSKDIAKRKNDIPLLHDRTLYMIEKANYKSTVNPEAGYESFLKLIQRLNQVLVKSNTWKRHYSTCIYNLGAIAYHLEREQDAIQYLEQHLEYEPKHIETRKMLVDLFYEKGKFDDAIPHLKVCLAAYGKDNTFWFKLGRCFFETGKFEAAFKCFTSIGSKDRDTLFYGARSYAKAGKLKNAIEWYQILLKQCPNDNQAIYHLASSFAYFKEDNKAIKIVSLLGEDDPYYSRAQVIIGNMFFRSDKLVEAGEAFFNILQNDPDCIQALVGLGQLSITANEKEKAIDFFQQAKSIDDTYPPANYFLGMLIETTEVDRAVLLYEHAAVSSDFKLLAERRLGRIYFFKNDYASAIDHFGIAVSEGESSPWYLYLYAFSLVSKNEIEKCKTVLDNIFASGQDDSEWKSNAANAMYSLGLQLFEKDSYTSALKCFEFLKEITSRAEIPSELNDLIEEANLRMVVQLIVNEDFNTAFTSLRSLQEQTTNDKLKQLCMYYSALVYLFADQNTEANKLLNALMKKDSSNSRYLYHLVIAELGLGNDKQAADLLIKLRDLSDIPENIRIGMQTVRAYLEAKQGKLKNAEHSLADIPELLINFPGVKYLDQQILILRIFYLCHARDSKKIHTLIPRLNEDTQIEASALHATAAVECGELNVAMDIIKPFFDKSDTNKKLFSILSSELALKAIKDKNYNKGREYLEGIPSAAEEINNVCLLLGMSEELENVENIEFISSAIDNLTEYLSKQQDKALLQMLVHNLGILYLKFAILSEENVVDKGTIKDIWNECLNFWDEHILTNIDYWNHIQERFSTTPEKLKAFSKNDVDVIFRKFLKENFVDMFISYIMTYLSKSNEAGIERHIFNLKRIGEKSGYTKGYFEQLNSEYQTYSKTLNPQENQIQTWAKSIVNLLVQHNISEILLQPEAKELKQRFEIFQRCKTKYATPADYKVVQKQYNTYLMDALHEGISGNFTEAGKKIEKLFDDKCPPGIINEVMTKHITTLRESCLLPENEVALKGEFENLYSLVKGKKVITETKFM